MVDRLVVLSGPSGVGKDTVLDAWRVANPAVSKLVTYTTRQSRTGEKHGVDHHFVDEAEFEGLVAADAFVDHRAIFGFRYGLARADLVRTQPRVEIRVANIDVLGGAKVAAQYPHAITVFLLPPSIEELRRRLANRGPVDDGRLRRAQLEIDSAEWYSHKIVNQTVAETVERLESIVTR